MNTSAYFDASAVDTPSGLSPVLPVSGISGVPTSGSGLAGEVFVPGSRIWNIDMAEAASRGIPDVTFVASQIAYGASRSDTTVAEFLGDDAASIDGEGGALEFGPSALTLSGYIYIPPGVHEIEVVSDDGFRLELGGMDFMEFEGTRATDATARVAEFEGGLYEIDLLYFDAGGAMSLGLQIDGLPVDQSAFYQSMEEFQSPPEGTPLIPVEAYHPSFFLGEESLEAPVTETATEGADVIEGYGEDDVIDGLGGDDHLTGGYGDDILNGGDGNDVLDGGRGSDLLFGGDGDDLLIGRSDAGVQRIGQLAIDQVTRPDPDGEVNPETQKLYAYDDQPLVGDDAMFGGAGKDTFLIAPQINAKLDIIEKHVQPDGTINWAGVAGENAELHDHWVDSFGIDIIGDYNAEEDQIAIIGHTAVPFVRYEDVNGDGVEESIIDVVSIQHGNGGAHDRDLIGQVVVFGDRVEVEDIQTDDGVTYGIVDTYADVAEALVPNGEEKITIVDGQEVKGYDTREPMEGMSGGGHGLGTNVLGAVTGNPFAAFDNPNFDETMLGAPTPEGEEMEPTRAPYEPLGSVEEEGQTITGTNASETLAPEAPAEPEGLPGALGYWSFGAGMDGAHDNEAAGGAGTVKSYTLYENQALLNPTALTYGPDGTPDTAMYFNGEDSFAYLAHDPSMNITQGTIALWARPDDLGEKSMFVTKDHSGAQDGGHFRFGHTDEGGLFLRMAEGDGGSNHAWETDTILQEGQWQHLAVSFGEDGVTVYLDGVAVPDGAWTAVEGDVATPGVYEEAYLLANDEPWVFGADQYKTQLNETANAFATDNEDLRHEFEGGIHGFGVWGGTDADDVLTPSEINQLIDEGPGAALTNPSGPQPMVASDDVINGEGGDDTIEGGAGDDTLDGGAGNDLVLGGYGDDHVMGGAGNDTVDGGWGSDLVEGGDGDDVIRSRADVGEDRAGQLVLDDPTRPSNAIDETYLKLFDWVDQPLVGDDVLVGGAGRDHFQIETLINGTRESILDNVKDDSRDINWHGVAGENKYVHDHWVDGVGIDVIADFVAEEDRISVIGHTTQIDVSYGTVDTDGDGIDDEAVSIIHAYSDQGNGGGAHDQDSLGYIVVFGDRVEEEDVEINPGSHAGVVDTIDQLQEAFAPTGETKWTEFDGQMHLGYDTRDIEGDPMGFDPFAYSSNPWLAAGNVELASSLMEGLEPPVVLMSHEGGEFGGADQPIEIEHDPLQAVEDGTWSFAFTAFNPGNDQNQALFSKDHSGFKDGGHLTAYITGNGTLKVRFQGEDDQTYLFNSGVKIEANEQYHLAFTFEEEEINLYLNGELVDSDMGFPGGMLGNEEDLVFGASTRVRQGEDDNLQWHFNGTIENVMLLDRPITDVEAVFLSEAGGDIAGIDALFGLTEATEEEEPVAEEEPVGTGEAEDTDAPDEPAETGEGGALEDGEPEATDEVVWSE
jgi:Ca2+-binding RTX toxin-like protein